MRSWTAIIYVGVMLRPPHMHPRPCVRDGSWFIVGLVNPKKRLRECGLLSWQSGKTHCELWLRVGDIVRDFFFLLCRKYFESNWTLTIFFRSS